MAPDDWTKRWIHFICGFLVGAPAFAIFPARMWARMAEEPGASMGILGYVLVGGAVGGLLVGLVAMWRLDEFWSWLRHMWS